MLKRHLKMGASLLFACGLTACGGGGASLPTSSTLPAGDALALSTTRLSPYSYTAPWGGFGQPGAIYVEPQGTCGYIPSTAASNFIWPGALNGLKPGTTITISGTPSYQSAADKARGCPTGGIVATSIVVGIPVAVTPKPVPSPTPSATPKPPASTPTPTATPTAPAYVAPWGGYGAANAIYFQPQGHCGYIPATPASGYSWPAFLATLFSGTTVSVYGKASYQSADDQTRGCPTGGIAVTSIVVGVTSKPFTNAPSPTPATPTPTPTPAAPAPSSYTRMFPGFAGNNPLPANPIIHPQSQAMMDTIYGNQPNGWQLIGPGVATAQSTYYDATSSDPVHTIYCNELWGPASNGHQCAMNGKQIHIPAGAVPGANTDQHTSILQPDGCTLDDFWVMQKDMSQAVLHAEFGTEYNVCTGTGFPQSGGAGPTAGGASNRLGRAPLAELETGVIHHAIEVSVACKNVAGIVGQATSASSPWPCSNRNGPSIPYGAYLWSDIAPSGLPAGLDKATRMLCTALNQYGGVVSDISGSWYGLMLNSFWDVQGHPDYAAWLHANAPSGQTNPSECFPNGDWSHHIHVLAY